MAWGVSVFRRLFIVLAVPIGLLGLSSDAWAQTTLVLGAPNTQVIDTMIRNGSYATTNQDGPVILTRWSSVPEWERRTIFGFDTTTLPPGASITSAILTLTLKSGLGATGATRPVTAYRLTTTFNEQQATWINRQTATAWQSAGGDLGESYTTVMVTNAAGAKIDFNVTALVQRTVNGEFGSRQSRVALVDVGGGGDVKESFREYHASEASNSANRPKLTIVYSTGPPTGDIDVAAGGDLQLALNQVRPGRMVRLAAGATYVGNFTLPAKGGSEYVVLTTGGVSLPPPGTRIDPSYRSSLATIKSPNGMSALTTASGASYFRIVGVAFDANVGGTGDIITLGSSAQTSLAQVPHHIEIDRVLMSGDPSAGQKRAIAVNATHVLVANSDIRDIKAIGQDSQAICGWNTPGPITIFNNYLEAAGENIMFGGAAVSIPGVVPSDITVLGNVLAKNQQWRGTSWTVKNIFELKSARRVLVSGNLLEYNWQAAQPGYAVLFTPRNSGGQNPWSVVEDVEFSGNLLRHVAAGFNLLGHDDLAPSGQLARIVIKNNLVYDISSGSWGGPGIFAQIGGEPRDITIDHNTVMHSGNIITFYSGRYLNSSGVSVPGGPIVGFVFTNNLMKHNAYGIFGSGQAYGTGSLNYFAPGFVVRRNVFAGGPASRYPADNFFPSVTTFMATFQNAALNDYRLVGGSPYLGLGVDEQDLGCTVEGLLAGTAW
jgi:hypothetical protein